MGQTDHAIVCGINNYPAFPALGGPEHDARAFCDWLLNDAKVPDSNIKRVFSSDFANVAGQPVSQTKPSLDALNERFTELGELAFKNFGRVPRIGRRLYIYLAGHGITPRTSNPSGSAALLMANAGPQTPGTGFHLSGPAYAEWFRRAHAFDEILLFMDCCRNAVEDVDEAPVPFLPLRGGNPEVVKTFQALATQWDAPSFEQLVGTPPQQRGVFTYALIQAFKGARDNSGRLLASNLDGSIRIIINQLRNGDVPQFPKLVLGDLSKDIVILEDGTSLPRVTIEWDPSLLDKTISVLDGFGTPLSPAVTLTTTAAPAEIRLRPGLYQVVVTPDRSEVLKVKPGLNRDKQDVGHVTVN